MQDGSLLEPLASLQYVWLRQHGFTEKQAGDVGLASGSFTNDSLRAGLGTRLSWEMERMGVTLTPEVRGRVLYEFLRPYASYSPAYIGARNADFDVRSAETGRFIFAVGAGVKIAASRSFSGFIDVDGCLNNCA